MTARPQVLVVDDEPQIQRFLRHALEAAGYAVVPAPDARTAISLFTARRPDLVILDLGLPDLDGKAVIGQIRQTSDVPVVVLSANGREAEKIAALDLGANDFVEKPFGIGELLARMRASLRARGAAAQPRQLLTLGPLTIDVEAHRVARGEGEEAIRLTPREFDLLAELARHAGRVLTHRHLLQKVWGPAHGEDVAYLRVFIGQLRQKIERDPGDPELILTEPGVGYRAAGLE